MSPWVSIIILNWNGAEDTVECLKSLFNSKYKKFNIILVDNGSTDDSLSRIQTFLVDSGVKFNMIEEIDLGRDRTTQLSDAPVIILSLKSNYGYVKGNNLGMAYALKNHGPENVLLLNNDTIVPEDAIGSLVDTIDERIGIAGPRIIDLNTGEAQSEGTVIDRFTGEQDRVGWSSEERRVRGDIFLSDYVSGCAMMISSSVLPAVGLLDERFVSFWEETDLCYRAREKGFLTACNREIQVLHKGSASFNKISEVKEYYMTRNRFLFFKRHSSSFCYQSIGLYSIYHFTRRLGYLISTRNAKNARSLIRGVVDGLLVTSKAD